MRLAIPTVVALLAALAVTAATEEAKPSAVSTGDHSKHDWPWHKDDDKKVSVRVFICCLVQTLSSASADSRDPHPLTHT